MTTALIHLLIRAWFSLVSGLSTNTRGFVAQVVLFPVYAYAVYTFYVATQDKSGERFVHRLVKALLPSWRETVLLAAATVVYWGIWYSVSIVTTIYGDHVAIVAANSQLKTDLNAARKERDEWKRNFESEAKKPKVYTAQAADSAGTSGSAAVRPIRVEPPNSLRRRTIRLVNELSAFWADNPMPLQPIDKPTTEQDRERNAAWDRYWKKVQLLYADQYRDRVVGIIREYTSKGISTGFLEKSAQNHPFGARSFNATEVPLCAYDELCQLRELAFHVDAYDQVIILTQR